MAFSDDTIIQVWIRCGGRCECQRSGHGHAAERCPQRLDIGQRGRAGNGAWEARRVEDSHGNGLDNCEVLCWSCHRQRRTPGG